MVFITLPAHATDDAGFTQQRQALMKLLQDEIADTEMFTGVEKLSDPVVKALLAVPRHEFVPERLRDSAYENRPLPIGHGQTISQPYIVALMTHMLSLEAGDKVLEIGTGSGYQAAVLAEITDEVYTIEIIEPLADTASKRLQRLGYDRITTRLGDGYYGWEEQAPFDAIIVTAAGSNIPPPLIDQLKPGGVMIIPVGSGFFTQQLMRVEKSGEGKVQSRHIIPVRFVPLTGDH